MEIFRQRLHDQNRASYANLKAVSWTQHHSRPTAEVGFKPHGNFYVIAGLDFEANDPEAVRAIAHFSSLPRSELAPGVHHQTLLDVKRRAQHWDDNPFDAIKRKVARRNRPSSDIALYLIDGSYYTADHVANRLRVDRAVAVARIINLAVAGLPLTWQQLIVARPSSL